MNRLSPAVLQVIGVVLLVGSALFWAVSGRQNVELVSASMTLITLGSVWEVQEQTRRSARDYRLPGDPDDDEDDEHAQADDNGKPPKPHKPTARGKRPRVGR